MGNHLRVSSARSAELLATRTKVNFLLGYFSGADSQMTLNIKKCVILKALKPACGLTF